MGAAATRVNDEAAGDIDDELVERLKHGVAREVAHRRWVLLNRDAAIQWGDLHAGVTLGEGAFGVVKMAKHGPSGVAYALKGLRKLHIFASNEIAHVNNECALLESCHHPFILRMRT